MNSNTSQLIDVFREKYGNEDVIVEAPGRINLIGEHTDYNDGFVLPAAINKVASFVISRSGSADCEIIALDLDEVYKFSIEDKITPVNSQWINYFLGVIHELKDEGAKLEGFNLIFSSNIPIGAGLSSSAAIEVGFGYSIVELFSLSVDKRKLALIGQQAEHKFAKVNCGIMDQFASALSREGHVIQLDCRSLAYEFIPADLGEYQIILFDTMIEHDLASTEYNIRREQCDEGVDIMRKINPAFSSLRDITLADLDLAKDKMPQTVHERCTYVIEENVRVLEASEALKNGNIKKLGALMYQTHSGLSKLYEVSCKELDLLNDIAKLDTSIIGSRMMGGGFGGCTINLIQKEGMELSLAKIKKRYKEATGSEPGVYIVEIAAGVRRLNN